jgi:endothelin-converting enzyme/putative endopeptidase
VKRALLALPLVALACAASPPPEPPPPPQPLPPVVPVASVAPPAGTAPSIDESALDPSVAPCDDFYRYACGGWMKSHPIPPDRSSWGRGSSLGEQNLERLRTILERDAAGQGGADPYARKLGDFWTACMDERKAEDRAPIERELARVAAVKDARSLARAVAHLQLMGGSPLFAASSGPDYRDATRQDLVVWQAGLGLPDRDYYFDDPTKPDAHKTEVRAAYTAHVAAMFRLAGEKEAQAKKDAATVLAIETKLAGASVKNVDLRDPANQYHWVDRDWLEKEAGGFAWGDWLAEMGRPDVKELNVAQTDFFRAVGVIARTTPPADLRSYLRWWTLHTTARLLDAKTVAEDFRYRQVLGGAKELAPRWKRCVRAIDGAMGEALAVPFVREVLGADGKARALDEVKHIVAATQANLVQLPWMDAPTRKAALEKLGAIAPKIGYPDTWRNYDALELGAGSYFDAATRAATFEVRRQMAKVGKPVDRSEWDTSPPTVDAWYRASQNDVTFPAGILQPPFFGGTLTRAMEYGAIGPLVGHEITHGFDDQGRKFDAVGNNRDWWSPPIAAGFEQRADCLREQYGAYTVLDGVHVNGKLTAGENIADLGGLKAAWRALQAARAERPDATAYAVPEERQFFVAYAQSWCRNIRDEQLHTMVSTDEHAPPPLRVNGVLSNTPEFATVFSCQPGSRMINPKRCEVW